MKHDNIIKILNNDGVGILGTDTIYGLVGLALSKKVVERIYQLKKRIPSKPFIILISSIEDLKLFEINFDQKPQTINHLQSLWPNPVSIVLPCNYEKFEYLHRGTNTLAFRIPNKPGLLELLKQTGPLVAPSANPEGFPPAQTIAEAKKYFGNNVDFYLDSGKLVSEPSTLIEIKDEKINILRQGSYKV
ncbi:MAG: L-threonylcarbamoyladenylate synthase [Candidatus Daviesbacteria bacterium]|nr:L-threonylcarbamoyladenylate synthase [Candidatus Daviesbacteria bacterium]